MRRILRGYCRILARVVSTSTLKNGQYKRFVQNLKIDSGNELFKDQRSEPHQVIAAVKIVTKQMKDGKISKFWMKTASND